MIPQILRHKGFRFIKVKDNKAPMEKEWTTKNNYAYNDKRFVTYVNRVKRFGILCGKNNLIVLDFDSRDIQELLIKEFPPTFTVKSAGRGLLHLYYFCDKPESSKILSIDKQTLVDIQGTGKQVIGPGSIINGKQYKIVNDAPVSDISLELINSIFDKWKTANTTIQKKDKQYSDADCEEIKSKISIKDILEEYGINSNKNPTDCPLHSSKGGRCFSYTDKVWHCFHCSEKGNIFHLVMLKDGIKFPEAKKILAKKSGIELTNKQVFTLGYELQNFMFNVSKFCEHNPFFYDKNGLFWFWNEDLHKYEEIDETDLMNAIDDKLGFSGYTVSPKIKACYMESFRRIGRKNKPKDAPIKWIQFKDKAFSLDSGNIYDVQPNYFFTNPIPWELGPHDKTPTIDRLFTEWVGKQYKQDLYELIAYCCYSDYPIQLIFCLFGHGRNGKTQFLKLLTKYIGKENVCSTELDTLIDNRFEAFKLYKKLVCCMGETNFGTLKKTSLIKKLVGGDLIGFEKKNKDPFDDSNYSKIIIASNSLPASDDTSDGYMRRWNIIEFPNQFKEGKDIISTIPDEEFRNLAKKSVIILKNLLDLGNFTNQGSVETRTDRYMMVSNPFPLFVKEYCEKDENLFVSYALLYISYVNYLKKHKKRRVKRPEFKVALENEGLWIEKTSRKIGMEIDEGGIFKNTYWVDGIKLKKEALTLGPIGHYDITLNQGVIYRDTSEIFQTMSEMSQKKKQHTIKEEYIKNG